MQSAYAAKNVIVEYENNRITIPFKQLQKFAKTGTAKGKLKDFLDSIPLDTKSAPVLLNGAIPETDVDLNQKEIEFLLIQIKWNTYFKLLKLDPEEFRGLLTTEAKMEMKFLDGILNNLIGEYILFQVGQVIYTSKNTANIQALRSALILSAAGDNKISMLEILQNYPSQKVVLEGMKLVRAAKNLTEKGIVKTSTARLEDILVDLQQFGAKKDCREICPTGNSSS